MKSVSFGEDDGKLGDTLLVIGHKNNKRLHIQQCYEGFEAIYILTSIWDIF